MRVRLSSLALAGVVLGGTGPAFAQALPGRVGMCVQTTITEVSHRLTDGRRPIPGSGSMVAFANRGVQVGYDEVPAIAQSRPGDRVLMCLVALPENCPPNDNRGRVYTTTNLRTMSSWTMADSEHACGGA